MQGLVFAILFIVTYTLFIIRMNIYIYMFFTQAAGGQRAPGRWQSAGRTARARRTARRTARAAPRGSSLGESVGTYGGRIVTICGIYN